MKRKERKITIIKILFIICIIYNILFLLNTTISKNNYIKIFGFSLFCAKDNLMVDDYKKNDLIIIKSTEELQKGDIIAYMINGQTRINKIINDKDGYTTMSNKNYYPDIEKVNEKQVIGKKILNIPFLGIILNILQSRATSLFIFIFLILYYSYNKYIYTQKKQRIRKKDILKVRKERS